MGILSNWSHNILLSAILFSLRLGLLHDSKEMRAACLRALRYYCQTEETVEALLDLHIDYLIARYCSVIVQILFVEIKQFFKQSLMFSLGIGWLGSGSRTLCCSTPQSNMYIYCQ